MQLSRQNKIIHGKSKFTTAKANSLRQKQIHHGKSKFTTAKANHSRQKANWSGQNKVKELVSGLVSGPEVLHVAELPSSRHFRGRKSSKKSLTCFVQIVETRRGKMLIFVNNVDKVCSCTLLYTIVVLFVTIHS